jgi:hypothetical protein
MTSKNSAAEAVAFIQVQLAFIKNKDVPKISLKPHFFQVTVCSMEHCQSTRVHVQWHGFSQLIPWRGWRNLKQISLQVI